MNKREQELFLQVSELGLEIAGLRGENKALKAMNEKLMENFGAWKDSLNSPKDVRSIDKEGLLKLGFVMKDSYPHDQYFTEEYSLSFLEVDLTYENGAIVTVDASISEVSLYTNRVELIVELAKVLVRNLG